MRVEQERTEFHDGVSRAAHGDVCVCVCMCVCVCVCISFMSDMGSKVRSLSGSSKEEDTK